MMVLVSIVIILDRILIIMCGKHLLTQPATTSNVVTAPTPNTLPTDTKHLRCIKY